MSSDDKAVIRCLVASNSDESDEFFEPSSDTDAYTDIRTRTHTYYIGAYTDIHTRTHTLTHTPTHTTTT